MITPKTLSGFKDRLPKEAMAKGAVLEKLARVFRSFGFVPIETPHLEYASILTQEEGEIQKELYLFKDHGKREVGLRFDQTVPLARFIAQHSHALGLPFKRYAIGNVFRGERAQKGRYREFTQCDFDFIGSSSSLCDSEIIQVIIASLKALDLEEFCVWINHRKILNGLCQHFGLHTEEEITAFLRIIDKLGKIGQQGVILELKACFPLMDFQAFLEIINTKQQEDPLEFFKSVAYLKAYNSTLKEGLEELEALFKLLLSLEINPDHFKIDFSIARGLGYYTGIVYETTLNQLTSLGSICSGGRYDNLSKSFSLKSFPGVGASIGLDRLLVALEELELIENKSTSARVLVVCMDASHFSYASQIAQNLRQSEINTELYPEIGKLKKPFGYANQKGHEFVVVLGEEEVQRETLTLKNMTTGVQFNHLSFLRVLAMVKE
ncbi:histidine--tRNA ligase [Helicobacter suis]|uniref:histidine--tRNA ligase n=1 Tax=Helicobacter suis TaxID=104628 RepID=UPI0001F7A3FB|nr:histidine--tRNA ligase [Helicobacter suis]EFX42894.1 histidyl-tRNA synthetase [Helicobacter suis HS1]BDR28234.1 histidine--tRNA ligase [Helicobacter suis HS1]